MWSDCSHCGHQRHPEQQSGLAIELSTTAQVSTPRGHEASEPLRPEMRCPGAAEDFEAVRRVMSPVRQAAKEVGARLVKPGSQILGSGLNWT